MVNTASLSPSLYRARETLPEPLRHPTVLTLLQLTVAEDVDPDGAWTPDAYNPATNDVTSIAALDPGTHLEGRLLAKEAGVAAGLPLGHPALLMGLALRLGLRFGLGFGNLRTHVRNPP